ncbi:hypothetical protein [Rossellomorea marisflavi]|nr:hypothetical protein [Rossellomorea marisflavi]
MFRNRTSPLLHSECSAAPKRLTARHMESGWPQRNETVSSPLHTPQK